MLSALWTGVSAFALTTAMWRFPGFRRSALKVAATVWGLVRRCASDASTALAVLLVWRVAVVHREPALMLTYLLACMALSGLWRAKRSRPVLPEWNPVRAPIGDRVMVYAVTGCVVLGVVRGWHPPVGFDRPEFLSYPFPFIP